MFCFKYINHFTFFFYHHHHHHQPTTIANTLLDRKKFPIKLAIYILAFLNTIFRISKKIDPPPKKKLKFVYTSFTFFPFFDRCVFLWCLFLMQVKPKIHFFNIWIVGFNYDNSIHSNSFSFPLFPLYNIQLISVCIKLIFFFWLFCHFQNFHFSYTLRSIFYHQPTHI